jgi:hypothetical protein
MRRLVTRDPRGSVPLLHVVSDREDTETVCGQTACPPVLEMDEDGIRHALCFGCAARLGIVVIP